MHFEVGKTVVFCPFWAKNVTFGRVRFHRRPSDHEKKAAAKVKTFEKLLQPLMNQIKGLCPSAGLST